MREGGERSARLPRRPAGPPAHVDLGRRPEGGEPALGGAAAWASRGLQRLDLGAEPGRRRHPPVLAVDPGRARTAADDAPLHRELREDPRAGALRDLPASRPEAKTLAERRDGLREVGRERFPSRLELAQRGAHRTREPGGGLLRDLAHEDHLLEPLALAGRDRPGRPSLDDGDELARHDEQRPAHPEHADEGPLLVELPLDVGLREAGRARVHREKHGGGVARVQDDQAAGRLERARSRRARRCEPVSANEPCSPLVDVDALHAA